MENKDNFNCSQCKDCFLIDVEFEVLDTNIEVLFKDYIINENSIFLEKK